MRLGALLVLAQAVAAPIAAADARIGSLTHTGDGATAHCTAFQLDRALVTAHHCLPMNSSSTVNVDLGRTGNFPGLRHLSRAGDWIRPYARDAAVLCDAGLPAPGLSATTQALDSGIGVSFTGYAAPDITEPTTQICRLAKAPTFALLHLDCPVPHGISGAPVFVGGQVAGIIVVTSEFYSVAEQIGPNTLDSVCGADAGAVSGPD